MIPRNELSEVRLVQFLGTGSIVAKRSLYMDYSVETSVINLISVREGSLPPPGLWVVVRITDSFLSLTDDRDLRGETKN